MAKKIQYGNLFVEVPDDHIASNFGGSSSQRIMKNEKPEVPEKLEEKPVIFNPYDPATVGLAQVSALANIEKTKKSWISYAFYIFFIIIPFGSIDLLLISLALDKSWGMQWIVLIIFNIIIIYAISPYSIKFRKKLIAARKTT